MNETMVNLHPADAVLVPVVIGLTQVAKAAGATSRLAPAIGVALGIGLKFALFALPSAHADTLLAGVVIGLMSLGLYSGVKASRG